VTVINFHCHPPAYIPDAGRTEEAFLDVMQSDEIDHYCMLPLDLRGLKKYEDYPYMTNTFTSDNEEVLALRERFPEKVIPFVYVDPRVDNAAETVHQWIKEKAFKGVKLYPPIGFYPDEPKILKFFEEINELAVPIILHAGRVAPHPQLLCKYADPRYLEAAAYAAPDCNIVVGHAGNPWKEVTAAIVIGIKNMIIDITTGGGHDISFIKRMVDHEEIGARRIVWGSDGVFPSLTKLHDKRRGLTEAGVSDQDLDLIFGGTAARLLGIE
jgi:predicted TIM-barrel fold metal-dependent hydrolase